MNFKTDTNMKIYVIDQNMLQSPELAENIRRDQLAEYVLPDVALAEMCKDPDCLLTMRLGLEVFKDHADRVHFTLGIGEAMRIELATQKAVLQSDMLSDKFTKFGRELIKDLASGAINSNIDIQQRIAAARENLLQIDLSADDAKGRTKKLLDLLKGGLHPHLVKAIRSPGFPNETFVSLACTMASMYAAKSIQKNSSMSEMQAEALVDQNSLNFRYEFALVRHCLLHVKNGGDISNLAPAKELNHQLDLDYVLTSSYFDGLLTKDKRVIDGDQDLRGVISRSKDELIEATKKWLEELEEKNKGKN